MANPEPGEPISSDVDKAAEPIETIEPEAEAVQTEQVEDEKVEMVPISVLQKERKKRQQAQQKLEYYENLQKQEKQEEDYTKYESITKGEIGEIGKKLKRDIREEDWANEYPDRSSYIKDNLEEFLTKRPNLALAIEHSNNRLEEAWELMSRFESKKTAPRASPKRDAPLSPSSVPKSAGLNEAVDVMGMSDAEFKRYRESKRRRR
jgi:hypothetical protein